MRANHLLGVSVAIHVNGNALREHQADSADAKTALSYVEIVEGAEFSIVLTLEPEFAYRKDHLQVRLYLDGNRIKSHVMHLAGLKKGTVKSFDSVREYENGYSSYRKFAFAQHRSTDDKSENSLVDKLSKLGEVTVIITPCRETHRTKTTEKSRVKFTAVSKDGIPEKALKGRAISHHAVLREVTRREKTGSSKVHVTYPFGNSPISTHTFRYRSRRDLEIEGIIKSRPFLPLEHQAPEDLTPEEARELVRRMRAEKEKDTPAKIKPEMKFKPESSGKRQRSEVVNLDDSDGEGVSITSIVAVNTKRAKTAGSSGVEVLDLTGE